MMSMSHQRKSERRMPLYTRAGHVIRRVARGERKGRIDSGGRQHTVATNRQIEKYEVRLGVRPVEISRAVGTLERPCLLSIDTTFGT